MLYVLLKALCQDYDSDALDDPEAPVTKKRKANSSVAKDKAKKLTKKDDDHEDEDEDNDPYTLLSKMGANPRPANGSIEKCAECDKEFSVVCSLHLAYSGVVDHKERRVSIR